MASTQFPVGQAQAHKAHPQLQGQAQPLALGLLVRRGEEPDDPALVGAVESKQLLRRQKGTRRAARHKVRRSLRNQSQIEVTGEPPIIEFNVPRLQMRQLLAGQSHFAHGAGFQPGIPTGPIEHVIDHREASLRIAGARRPMLIGGAFPAKGSSQRLAFGQTYQRTVDAHQRVRASVGWYAPGYRSPARRSRDCSLRRWLEQDAQIGTRLRQKARPSPSHPTSAKLRGKMAQGMCEYMVELFPPKRVTLSSWRRNSFCWMGWRWCIGRTSRLSAARF